MANNRDLLREAIADAKAVKETAIANAKASEFKSQLSLKEFGYMLVGIATEYNEASRFVQ